MKYKCFIPLLICSLGLASAQTNVGLPELCQQMFTSRVQVVAYLPSLESQVLAECLRQAKVDYRRKVLLLTVPYFAQSSRSYVSSLALADIPIFEANVNSTDGVILIDDIAFTASNLGASNNPALTAFESNQIRPYVQWFNRALKSARYLSPVKALRRLNYRR
jgi:hypothetical protein